VGFGFNNLSLAGTARLTEEHDMSEIDYPGLTIPQGKALIAFLSGKTYAEIATEMELSVSTIYRWMKLPTSRQAINEMVSAAIKRTCARLAEGVDPALDVLTELMAPGKPDTIRLTAATTWANLTLRIFEYHTNVEIIDAFEERIRGLEELRNG
jgi:hypothetical protein